MAAIPWAPRPIPQSQPSQVHLSEGMDQWLGDSEKAAKKAGKGGHTDTNLQPLLNGVGAIHKNKPRGTGWSYLAIGGGRRRLLTAAELDTEYSLWPREKFSRLRRTKRAGLRFESRVRPLLFAESLAAHKKYGAIPCFELKALMGKKRAVAMVNLANARQVTAFFKTLVYQSAKAPTPPYSMKAAGEKLAELKAAGGQTALATHGYPPPHDLEDWRHAIDAYWGSTARRYRP